MTRMRVLSVVGARPQFVKAATLSRELRRRHDEILVHTGQHYDYEMSGAFFDGLAIPAPDVNLAVGSGPHGVQTALMLQGIEAALAAHRPDWLVVYGDTNSTLAAALAGAKACVPVAHVEAGLRSFDRRMPEEINRIVADHVADALLCPSAAAAANLEAEGLRRNVHVVGDVMLDVLEWARGAKDSSIMHRLGVKEGAYVLATVHRSGNTDDDSRLRRILKALDALEEPVVFPVHPRTRNAIARLEWSPAPRVQVIPPVGYLEMLALAEGARVIATDSGGLQKEAYWLGVPCVTLRDETEWVETVAAGWNVLAGCDDTAIVEAAKTLAPPAARPPLYGDGHAASRCVDVLATR
jgi:UDP-N-acetylglucosamine 2-epimerase